MKAGLQRVPSLREGLAGHQIRRSGNRHGCEYGAEGGPDAENGDTGQTVYGEPYAPPSIKMVVRLWLLKERQYHCGLCRRRPDCTWSRTGYTLNGGYQYVHNGGTASGTVVTVTAGRLSRKVVWRISPPLTERQTAGERRWYSHECHPDAGSALVTSTAAMVLGSNRLGNSRWKTVRLTALFWSPAVAWSTGRPFSAENTGG